MKKVGNCVVDTMNTCLLNCKNSTDDLMKQVDLISSLFQEDLCDNLDQYEKQYSITNKENLKRANEMYGKYLNDN